MKVTDVKWSKHSTATQIIQQRDTVDVGDDTLVLTEATLLRRRAKVLKKEELTLLNFVLSSLSDMYRGCERDHQSCGSGSSRVVSYLLFTSPHYCMLAGTGGSVNIINMTVISPVPHCMEKLVLGRKMKHLSAAASLLWLLLCREQPHSQGAGRR